MEIVEPHIFCILWQHLHLVDCYLIVQPRKITNIWYWNYIFISIIIYVVVMSWIRFKVISKNWRYKKELEKKLSHLCNSKSSIICIWHVKKVRQMGGLQVYHHHYILITMKAAFKLRYSIRSGFEKNSLLLMDYR